MEGLSIEDAFDQKTGKFNKKVLVYMKGNAISAAHVIM